MPDEALSRIRALLQARLAQTSLARLDAGVLVSLQGGKMLRARLAARLLAHSPARADQVLAAAAAVELVHAASLLHDDVIDGGELRRGAPTFWRRFGPSGAILAGDLLFCAAAELLAGLANGHALLRRFVTKVHEVCDAEAEQEILLRGCRLDLAHCVDIARRKTGPLFAFAAEVCGGADEALSCALEETGYAIGTAYQLADDLLDQAGDEQEAGKSLGSDRERRKLTLPQLGQHGAALAREQVQALCAAAVDQLAAWPEFRDAVGQFLSCDLQPVFEAHRLPLDTCVGLSR